MLKKETKGNIVICSTDSLICLHCVYFWWWMSKDKPRCMAFPDGIPEEILKGENEHSKPLPKQKNDFVFTGYGEEEEE